MTIHRVSADSIIVSFQNLVDGIVDPKKNSKYDVIETLLRSAEISVVDANDAIKTRSLSVTTEQAEKVEILLRALFHMLNHGHKPTDESKEAYFPAKTTGAYIWRAFTSDNPLRKRTWDIWKNASGLEFDLMQLAHGREVHIKQPDAAAGGAGASAMLEPATEGDLRSPLLTRA